MLGSNDTLDRPAPLFQAFRGDVLTGLASHPKTLPSRWLYDETGSELFERITAVEEYYPTRSETELLARWSGDIATFVGANAVVIEYGAGAGVKTEMLLRALKAPLTYVPIDIAGDFLDMTVSRLRAEFPWLPVYPVTGDFTRDVVIPAGVPTHARTAFFPGSTLGNLNTDEAGIFLRRMRAHVGVGGRAIIGIDLRKKIDTLLAAYDDREGVTAAFNLNLLARINRELEGRFDLSRFRHEARWNEDEGAVEMHLVSLADQIVSVAGQRFGFTAGETIHTESSRKYTLPGFARSVAQSGWDTSKVWTDLDDKFAVIGLTAIEQGALREE